MTIQTAIVIALDIIVVAFVVIHRYGRRSDQEHRS
jgi:hypothetical protein